MYGLGRLRIVDSRDRAYSVRKRLKKWKSTKTYQEWDDSAWTGNQGQTSECAAYAGIHWLEAAPVLQGPKHPCYKPHTLYLAAQQIDGIPGRHDGTTIRAVMKCLKRLGYVSAYHWATTLTQMVQTVLQLGPMVIGTDWYEDMYEPTKTGLLNLTGDYVGGHATLVVAVDVTRQLFKIKNQWGRDWGIDGHAYLRFNDMERLLRQDGEAAIASEVRKS